jgi:hypothetical protein
MPSWPARCGVAREAGRPTCVVMGRWLCASSASELLGEELGAGGGVGSGICIGAKPGSADAMPGGTKWRGCSSPCGLIEPGSMLTAARASSPPAGGSQAAWWPG